MSFFEKNIQVIKEQNIVLYEQLQKERLIDRVMSEPARDGKHYLKVHIGGKWVAMNSTYRPEAEAFKFAGQYGGLPAYGRILVFGFGNGCMVRALLSANPITPAMSSMEENSHVKWAFYEPDAAVFSYVMQTCDLTDILTNRDVSIFVEGMNESQLAAWCVNHVGSMNENSFQLISLPKYRGCYHDAFDRVSHVYENAKLRIQCDMNTSKKLSRRITENNLFNLKYFVNGVKLRDFKEMYPQSLPMLIVSAGPSLASSISQIASLYGMVFIMATDTAAWYLMEHGIRPDGIIAIDPEKDLFLFHKEMQDILFFVHADVNHLVLDKVAPENVCFISSNLQYYEAIAKKREDVIPCLDTGGCVATMALSLAIYLGAKTCILTGQDLSVTEDATHVTGTNRQDKDIIMVSGNEETSVATYTDFYLYLQWFQAAIAMNPQIQVVNATFGGAKIEGAAYMHGDALKEQFDVQAAAEGYHRWKQWMQNIRPDGVWDSAVYREIRETLFDIRQLLKQGADLAEQAKEAVLGDNPDRETFIRINSSLKAVSDKLITIPEFEWLESYAKASEDEVLRNLYEGKGGGRQDLTDAYERLGVYYRMLYENVDPVVSLCRQAEE